MKIFIFAACVVIVLACYKEPPKKSTCVACVHAKCSMTLSICDHTGGCSTETACLLDCGEQPNEVAFKLCAIKCVEVASDVSTEASKDFITCFADKCEPICGKGTSL